MTSHEIVSHITEWFSLPIQTASAYSALETLDLSWNHIRFIGAIEIAKGIKVRTSI